MPYLFLDEDDRQLLLDFEEGITLEVGRSPAADVSLKSERASRRHCRIEARGDAHVLVDLGSSNGTRLNGETLEAEQALRDGDQIQVGAALLVYRTGG